MCYAAISSFSLTGGRERPARAALALVLHWRDDSLLAPVDLGGQCGAIVVVDDSLVILLDCLFVVVDARTAHLLVHFVLGHVAKLVHTHLCICVLVCVTNVR